MIKKKAVFHWSGGKDSALALQDILKKNEFEVVSLLTTFDENTNESNVHSIPLEILEKQAQSIKIPLYKINMNNDLKNYEIQMNSVVKHFKKLGVTHFIFGDLDTSGMKPYREKMFHPLGIEVVQPLANKTSEKIMQEFLDSNIQAKIIVIQEDKLDKSFLTKALNQDSINLFPTEIDVCGEFGEYHTLTYAGDLYEEEIKFSFGEKFKTSHEIKLNNGEIQVFNYWQVKILN